jgi:hypothetical protein
MGGEEEMRALAGLALDPDAPAVGLDQMAGDGQPQPRPPVRPGPGFLRPVEPIEDIGQILRGDPHPGVADAHLHLIPEGLGLDGDPAAGRRVAEGIGEQVH